MGIGSRIGMIITNFLIMIPLFILLLASAIISSMAQESLSKLADQSDAIKNSHDYVRYCTITLWVLFAIAFLGNIFIGMVASIPYLYAFIMGIFIVVNLTIAGIFFYSANNVRNSSDYKQNTDASITLFRQLLGIGIIMVVSSMLLLFYIIWGIRKYHKEGGVAGDVGYISEAGMVIAPELAPVWMAGQQYSKSNLGEEDYNARSSQVQSLIGAGQQFGDARSQGGDSSFGGIINTIKSNPKLMAAAFEALA